VYKNNNNNNNNNKIIKEWQKNNSNTLFTLDAQYTFAKKDWQNIAISDLYINKLSEQTSNVAN